MKDDRIFLYSYTDYLFHIIFLKCCHSCNRGLMNYKSDRIGWQEPCHPPLHRATKNVGTFQVKRLGVWVKTLRRFLKMLRRLLRCKEWREGVRTPVTTSILCISLLRRCCTGGSKLPFSPIETRKSAKGTIKRLQGGFFLGNYVLKIFGQGPQQPVFLPSVVWMTNCVFY